MNGRLRTVLCIDDNQRLTSHICGLLSESSLHVQIETATTYHMAQVALHQSTHDLYVLGGQFAAQHRGALVHTALAAGNTAPVIVIADIADCKEAWETDDSRIEYIPIEALNAFSLEQTIRQAVRIAHMRHQCASVEADYRAIVNSSQLLVFEVDTEGCFTTLDEAFLTHIGLSCEQLVGTSLLGIVHPDDRDYAAQVLQQVWEGDSNSRKLEVRYSVGVHTGWFELSLNLRQHPDQPLSCYAVAFDITERKQSEARLRASQKMELIGQFVAGVAHDFNNILTAIGGYAEFLLDGLALHDPLRQDAQEIGKSIERASVLTRQLLAVNSRHNIQPEVLNINAAVADVDILLRRLIGEDIELTTRLDPRMGMTRMDVGELEHVLLNLVVNARDAMPDGGRLLIETKMITADDSFVLRHLDVRPGPCVMMAVTDTGRGRDRSLRKPFVEPLVGRQLSDKDTEFGLAIVHTIVKQNGGDIWIYSHPEYGTTCKVYLPSVVDAANTERAHATSGPSNRIETVLVVEDDPAVRHLTRMILQRFGYNVLEASNGNEALQIACHRDVNIDLLFTDVIMPEMGGPALAERMLITRPNLPVVFVSGYTDIGLLNAPALPTGAAFLHKPFSSHALAHILRTVLNTTYSALEVTSLV